MRDLANNIGVVQALAPQVLAATDTSAAIDLLGFESAGRGDQHRRHRERRQTHRQAPGERHDDERRLCRRRSCASHGGAHCLPLAATTVYKQGYIGNKRYLRLVTTKNSGTSIAVGAVVVKGNPHESPVA